MERDINVVAQVKDNGDVSYRTGDGLPLENLGEGSSNSKWYSHYIEIRTTSNDDVRLAFISKISKPFTRRIEFENAIFLEGEIPNDGYPIFHASAYGEILAYNIDSKDVYYTFLNDTIDNDTVTEWPKNNLGGN